MDANSPPDPTPPEVSVVMPCLNEAETLAICIDKALSVFRRLGIDGEVVVADNGSTDDSPRIAATHGARVVVVDQRGYGAALMGGIAAARAPFIIMGDADDSYDFLELDKFIQAYRNGGELVQGCRLPAGGGTVMPGAMPPLHRWFGNPVLSWLVRRMFRVPITDVYCGMRGFTRRLYHSLDMRCPGMEFATEMVIKAGMRGAVIAEVPITLHPDGRQSHGPHLRTFRDGWRTVRLFMIYSPKWTFFFPGLFCVLLGVFGYALALPQTRIAGVALDVHTLMVASLVIVIGYQAILFAVLAQSFAAREGMIPGALWIDRLSLEGGLMAGMCGLCCGAALIAAVVVMWFFNDFGALDYPRTMRLVVPGVLLATLGVQTIFASLYLGVLKMHPPKGR